jgi:hypothetical protein
MPSYEITIKGVKAENLHQAENLKAGFQTIANTLTPQEVIDLAQLLKENPGIVEKAKQNIKFL